MALGFVLVNTESGKDRDVYDRLLKVPQVKEMLPLFGEYELIIKLETRDFNELGEVVTKQIRSVPGVTGTKTLTGTKF